MADTISRARNEIPTIDCTLVTISTEDGEFGFDTANQIEVEVQTEDTDAVRLVVKGKLRAQKPAESTITGHELTLHDNVFNPELVLILQGGSLLYYADASKTDTTTEPTDFGYASYTPPVAGSDDKGKVFTLNVYSAIYNAAGVITGYEKTEYPNCQGKPVAFNSEDGAFRAPEYTITSAPNTGEAPYTMTTVKALPTLTGNTNTEGPDSGDVNKFSVTNELTNASSNNSATSVLEDASYEATITANEGYTINSLIVTMGGTDITSGVVEGNVINIPTVSGDIVITASAVINTYTITNNLTNATNSNTNTEITHGSSYTGTITADSGTLGPVTVTMGGTDISETAVAGGVISIASVTGALVITAEAS